MIVSYNWLKEYLGNDIPSPEEVARLLTFHSFEIESVEEKNGDTIIDVDILPNRSSDCLSQRGIARELATLLDVTLVNDPLATKGVQKPADNISITIENNEACPRFTLSLIESVTVGPSPAWLVERLAVLGVRSINNLVDATNYVMYAIGQPTHVYDADRFPKTDGQKYGVLVREAREGEQVSLLAEGNKADERIVTLKGGELLIVNEATDVPVGLAGVKGGAFAEVTKDTKNVLVEAAHFHPTLTRRTARGLGIVIDASKRFENEPARDLPGFAQTELCELIVSIAGGTYIGTTDVFPLPVTQPAVVVRPKRARALLGVELSIEDMKALLLRTGSDVLVKDEMLVCTSPFERTDLTIEEDFIEEIGRIYGYDKVKSVVPDAVPLAAVNQRHYYSERVRHTLMQAGFSEVVTSSFRKKDALRLQNALASDKGYLRSSLAKNLSEVLDKNAGFVDLLGAHDTRVFEIGTVFLPGDNTVNEHTSLALGVRLSQNGYSGKEDKVLQNVLRQLEEVLGVSPEWSIEKGIAEINFDALISTLPHATQYEAVEVSEAVTYESFSLYPSVTRDIAMWVDDESDAASIEAVLREHAGPLCVRITHVDEFKKEGRTSQAFRLVFQSKEKTLTDSEVHDSMNVVYDAVAKHQWEVR